MWGLRAGALASLSHTVVVVNIIQCIRCQTNPQLKSLSAQFWDWKILQFPEQATVDGFHQHDDKLESYRLSAFDERWNTCYAFKLQADAIERGRLNREDNLSLDILVDQLNTFIEGHAWAEYGNLNPISFIEGIHLRTSWVKEATYKSEEDYMKYLLRLERIPVQIEEIKTLMEKAVKLGRTLHKVSMRGVVQYLEDMANSAIHHSIFYWPLAAKLDSTGLSHHTKRNFRSKGMTAIRQRVQPAYKRLSTWIDIQYMPHTRRQYGVWSFTNGSQYYQSVLRWHLSVNMTPAEVHEIGLREVDRIKKEMERLSPWVINSAMERRTEVIKTRVGHASGDLPIFFEALREERQFFDHSERELLERFEKAVYHRIQPRLPLLFTDLGTIPNITIRRMPNDGIGAQYVKDTLLANTNDPETKPSFTVLALSLHEALPGHHLQISMAKQQEVPNYRRFIMGRKFSAPFHFPYYTAYVEGWGLYAEYLGEELGLFKDPYELFGRYCYEIFRACRLVVDTGIHVQGWSREEAVDYMANHTFLTRPQIEIEVDRYITWPGQACAYKIGELTIKRARRRAERRLGYRFDVQEFHSKVMKMGPAPLRILENMIEEWVDEQLPSAASMISGPAVPAILLMLAAVTLLTNVR